MKNSLRSFLPKTFPGMGPFLCDLSQAVFLAGPKMSCELLIFFVFVLIERLKAVFSVSTVRFHRLYQSPVSALK